MPTPDFNPETLHCQECENRSATVFLTKTVGQKVMKQSLCEACARRLAAQKLGDVSTNAPLEDVLRVLFQHNLGRAKNPNPSALEKTAASPDWWHSLVETSPTTSLTTSFEYSSDEDQADDEAEAMEELRAKTEFDTPFANKTENKADVNEEPDTFAGFRNDTEARESVEPKSAEDAPDNFAPLLPVPLTPAPLTPAPSAHVSSRRCPKCGTTWDRLKQDGRAGCALCYIAFVTELVKVLDKMQGASIHEGKTPRAMDKRQKRLLHLRLRRDHRLQMLNRRLEESLNKEDYAEAARLRDKIKVVSSTILED